MNFFQKIVAVWQRIGLVQRALLAAIALACVLTGVILTTWATKPDMRVLYKELDPDQAGMITDKLAELDATYELKAGGTSVYVPKEKVYELRLAMAKEGLPEKGQEGYKIFDQQKLGVSPMVQQMNLNRAIQDELAKTIQMIEGVEFARVHLVQPENTVFTTTPGIATASVAIKMKAGWRLGGSSINAITYLVAGSVDGLKAENVTVVDSEGNVLSNNSNDNGIVAGANTFMDYKERVEKGMESRVQDMLETVLGRNRSSVKVSANIKMVTEETVITDYKEGIKTDETITTVKDEVSPEVNEDGQSVSAGSKKSEEVIETKRKVPEIITKKVEVPGEIISVSVAAVVDLSVDMPASGNDEEAEEGENENAAAASVPEKMMDIEQVKDIIRKAVGPKLLLDETGEETLTVIEAPFNRVQNATAAISTDEGKSYKRWNKIMEIVRQSSMGTLSICAMIVLWIFTRAINKPEPEESKRPHADLESLGLLPSGEQQEPIMVLRSHISGKLKENPEQVKQLFASWLEEGT